MTLRVVGVRPVTEGPRETVGGIEQQSNTVLAQDGIANGRYRYAHGRDHRTRGVPDRGGDASHAGRVLLFVRPVSPIANRRELDLEGFVIADGMLREPLESDAFEEPVELAIAHPAQPPLPNAGALPFYPPPDF